jgi:hypothetical protein
MNKKIDVFILVILKFYQRNKLLWR